MVEPALKMDENAHPWLPEIQTLLLLNIFLIFGQCILLCQGLLLSVVEPSGSINGIVPLVRSSWLRGGELPSASAGLGVGGTKIDWKKQVGDMEKLLSTASSGSATFGCSVTWMLCVPWECSGVVLVSIGIWLEGQTPFLPAWSLGVCAGIKPCCCAVGCGSGGLQARGLGTNSSMLLPFLEIEIYLS